MIEQAGYEGADRGQRQEIEDHEDTGTDEDQRLESPAQGKRQAPNDPSGPEEEGGEPADTPDNRERRDNQLGGVAVAQEEETSPSRNATMTAATAANKALNKPRVVNA